MAQVSFQLFNKNRRLLREICESIKERISDWESKKLGLDLLTQCEGNIINEPPRNAENAQEKLDAIIERLRRERMKISFFGRNSCGKSTVINALLGSNVLPTGMGHVTPCFVHLQETERPEGYFKTEDKPDEEKAIDKLDDVANCYQDGHATTNSVVRVYWPKSKSEILSREFILIDSPGSAISATLDNAISEHCKDSDVFIIVLNADCVLSKEELEFFHRVNNDIGKADVFIVINRWDFSDDDKNRDKVQQGHVKKCAEFLVQDTHVSSTEEATERIFFISAKEKLVPPSERTEARIKREDGFKTFEKIFDSFKSTSFQSKLEPHFESTLDICKLFRAKLDNYSERIENLRSHVDIKRDEHKQSTDAKDELNATQLEIANGMQGSRQSFKEKISDDVGRAKESLIRMIQSFNFDHEHPSSNHVEVLSERMRLEFESLLGQCRDQTTELINADLRRMACQLTTHVPINQRTEARNILGPDIDWTLDLRDDLRTKASYVLLRVLDKAVQVGGAAFGVAVGSSTDPILGAALGSTAGALIGQGITLAHQKLFRTKLIRHVTKVLDELLPQFETRVLDQIIMLLQTEFNRTYNDCLIKLEEIIQNRVTEVDELEAKRLQASEICQSFRDKVNDLERRVADLLEAVQNPPHSDTL